jgi:hypothetical protein
LPRRQRRCEGWSTMPKVSGTNVLIFLAAIGLCMVVLLYLVF